MRPRPKPAADEFEAEAGRGEGEPAAAGEGEPSRPRRRRRRRRGGERSERGERPTGEGFSAEAPQPTDDGLAAMAEIGGDFAVPARGEGETAEDEERAPSARRRRGRRGRRGGGDRERFGAPAPTGDATPIEGEAEPNLFDEPPREQIAAEPEPVQRGGGSCAARSGAGSCAARRGGRPGRTDPRPRGGARPRRAGERASSRSRQRTGGQGRRIRGQAAPDAGRRRPVAPAPLRLVAARARDAERGVTLARRREGVCPLRRRRRR